MQSKKSSLALPLAPKRPHVNWPTRLVAIEQAPRQKGAIVVDEEVENAIVEPKLKNEECCQVKGSVEEGTEEQVQFSSECHLNQ